MDGTETHRIHTQCLSASYRWTPSELFKWHERGTIRYEKNVISLQQGNIRVNTDVPDVFPIILIKVQDKQSSGCY